MLQAFIVTLREGVEAALIVGITLAYLAKIGRTDLRRSVYAGMGAAFVGSIGVAILVSRLSLNQDIVEGWVMLAAAFFVITMIIFMMRTGKKMKGEIESKLQSLASESSRVGVFLFIFLMILREGVETVLTLAGVTLNSTELMTFIGTLLGVLSAVAFGVMFVKGSVRINLQKFFRVTTVILSFVAAQLRYQRPARIVGERRAAFLQTGNGHDRAHRPQRRLFLHHDFRAGRPHGPVRSEVAPAGAGSGHSCRTAQGDVDGPPRAPVDGIGLRQLLSCSSCWSRRNLSTPRA